MEAAKSRSVTGSSIYRILTQPSKPRLAGREVAPANLPQVITPARG